MTDRRRKCSFRLTEESDAKLDQLAAELDKSRTDVVEQLIQAGDVRALAPAGRTQLKRAPRRRSGGLLLRAWERTGGRTQELD